MFTGIIEELGVLQDRSDDRFIFKSAVVVAGTAVGDSIAVNGCCLTVTELEGETWSADVSSETKKRTTFDSLRSNSPVNFERSVRLTDRLGGHLVQGHVDAVGEVVDPAPNLRIKMPAELLRYVVEKGSISVDGVSLTVVELFDDGFSVALIPHTMQATTLGTASAGDLVNLEVDVMAKYAERLLSFALPAPAGQRS